MHHRNGLVVIEFLLFRSIFIELEHPCTLEVEGIQQVAHRCGVEFILGEYLRNHSVGMVIAPLVDHVERQSVVKVTGLGRGIIVLLCGLYKGRFQPVALCLVHIDGVGYAHRGLLVKLRCLAQHLAAELVDGSGFA